MNRQHQWKIALPALVAGTALSLSACGASIPVDDPGIPSLEPAAGAPAASSLEAPEDPDEAMALFENCLRDNGVDLPAVTDAGSGGVAVEHQDGQEPGAGDFAEEDMAVWEQAALACEGHLANIQDVFQLDPEQEAALADVEAEFRQCLADEGVDVAALGGGAGADGAAPGGAIALEDEDLEAFEAALTTCGEIIESAVAPVEGSSR